MNNKLADVILLTNAQVQELHSRALTGGGYSLRLSQRLKEPIEVEVLDGTQVIKHYRFDRALLREIVPA